MRAGKFEAECHRNTVAKTWRDSGGTRRASLPLHPQGCPPLAIVFDWCGRCAAGRDDVIRRGNPPAVPGGSVIGSLVRHCNRGETVASATSDYPPRIAGRQPAEQKKSP